MLGPPCDVKQLTTEMQQLVTLAKYGLTDVAKGCFFFFFKKESQHVSCFSSLYTHSIVSFFFIVCGAFLVISSDYPWLQGSGSTVISWLLLLLLWWYFSFRSSVSPHCPFVVQVCGFHSTKLLGLKEIRGS